MPPSRDWPTDEQIVASIKRLEALKCPGDEPEGGMGFVDAAVLFATIDPDPPVDGMDRWLQLVAKRISRRLEELSGTPRSAG